MENNKQDIPCAGRSAALERIPAATKRMRTQLQFAIAEKRQRHQSPRVVKALPKRYAVLYLKKNLN